MSELGALFLAGRDWLGPATTGLALILAFVVWSYVRTKASHGLRLACAALKTLGLTALAACLLEPTWTGERAKPGANLFALIADNSQSMTLRGPGEPETRATTLTRLLRGEQNQWRTQLAENFEVRNYLADSRLQGTQDFADLSFEGRTSALGHALAAHR
jgi:hypothetical protein